MGKLRKMVRKAVQTTGKVIGAGLAAPTMMLGGALMGMGGGVPEPGGNEGGGGGGGFGGLTPQKKAEMLQRKEYGTAGQYLGTGM